MQLDPAYLAKLTEFLNGKYLGTIQNLNSDRVTTNKAKLIFHLKHHIDSGNSPTVDFNSDYSRFRVYGENVKAKEYHLNNIDPEFWIITRKRRGYVPIMGAETEKEKSKSKTKTKKPTNSNEYTGERIEY